MSLDAAAFQRLDRAIALALELPREQRDAALVASLGDTPNLLEAARAAFDPASSGPALGAIAPGLLAAWDADSVQSEDARWRGRLVGAWRVLDRLGAGGMGTVYRVQRADGTFERTAALKLLPLSLQNEELRLRFAQERRIAARLQHPGIAQLIDAGSTEDGSPYLVLEYIEGEPIDEHCDRRGLDLRQRLRLLGEVCTAVQFAHRNLVVHRDLKPANILVNTEGRVKLLDFGIARLLEDTDAQLQTGPLGTRLTPDYAAPEQFLGEPVSAATDVYALGCLMYRLLAGRVPLGLSGRGLAQMLDTLQQAPRPTLSAQAAQGQPPPGLRRRELDADLDAIALRAVAVDPDQRYAAVAEFVADLRRWQDGLPVLARRAGRRYRIGRFLRRHRLGLGMTAAVFVALGGSAALALYQAGQAREQRDEAKAMAGLLRELMQLADPDAGLGHRIGAHALLRTALARIETDPAAQPASRIALLDTLAQALQAFELFDEAIRARELAYQLQTDWRGPGHADTEAALRELALALRGRRDDRARTEQLLSQLRAARLQRYGAEHPLSAESAWDLGFFYLRYSDPAHPGRTEAEPLLHEAWTQFAQTLGEEHPRTAHALFDLGLATGARALQIERMRRAIALREQALGPDDPLLLQHQGDLALVLGDAGEADAAIALGRRAAEGYRRLRGDLHPLSITLWNNLAGLYRDYARYEEALALYRQIDERVRAVVPEGHLRRAFPQFGMGVCLNRLQRHAEAEAPLRAALAIVSAAGRLGLQSTSLRELGDSLHGQGRESEARERFDAALRILVDQLGRSADDPGVQSLRERLGEATQ